MKLPDGSVLMHGKKPYDPVKAHEYYIRTRQLKGRKTGRAETFTVKGRRGQSVQLTRKELVERQAYAAKRVAEIKKKLTDLKSELKKRAAEARKVDAKKKKGPTAADKAEAARDAKKYRDKNQQKLANKRKGGSSKKTSDSKPKKDSVGDLREKINKVQSSLKAAVERQRALSSATKNG